eukprot:TRINITY_DN1466_c0_g1_i3.p1 TRINITY_DN1466_c0_g1~~TRINITY_DN1466_c0_g1_i3.p1  ORF type:complete len:237 (-),score=55.03 TRINITY_DN1466_c0_g1_i3:213-923(-)
MIEAGVGGTDGKKSLFVLHGVRENKQVDSPKEQKRLQKEKREQREMKKIRDRNRNAVRKRDVREAVKCPPEETENEWICQKVIELHKTATLIYSLVSDECTAEKCPVMSAGPRIQYYWADGDKIKKPIKVSAPEYVNLLQAWIHQQLDDEAIFPSEDEFPKDFKERVKPILKRLFRVYAHVFCHHGEKIRASEAAEHVTIAFKHYFYFVKEFDLVDDKDLEPMKPVIDQINAAASS